MRAPFRITNPAGLCLLETVVVLAVLGVCLVIATLSLPAGIRRLEARGAARTWQATGGWAQTKALWQGTSAEVLVSEAGLLVCQSGGSSFYSRDLAPQVPLSTNVARWRKAQGVNVLFLGGSGAPDSGGSIYFKALRGGYKVVVRPESGLTASSWTDEVP